MISRNGGFQPRWRGDGKELFYLAPGPNPTVMAVDIDTGSVFEAGIPRSLFQAVGAQSGLDAAGFFVPLRGNPVEYWDVAPDGKRFLFLTRAEQNTPPQPYNIVLNWQAGLKK